MSNRLLPYDTIIKAHEGDPIAIQAVMEDYIRTKLIESLFKFRLDR